MNTQKDLLGATSTDMIFNGRQGLNNTSDSAPDNMTQPTDVSEKSQHKVVHNQHFLFHTPDSYQIPLGHTSSDKCQQLPEANTEADNSTPTATTACATEPSSPEHTLSETTIPDASKPCTLRLISYNIEGFRSCNPYLDILQKEADIIVQQEHWLHNFEQQEMNLFLENFNCFAKSTDDLDPISLFQRPRVVLPSVIDMNY